MITIKFEKTVNFLDIQKYNIRKHYHEDYFLDLSETINFHSCLLGLLIDIQQKVKSHKGTLTISLSWELFGKLTETGILNFFITSL